jgi:hypothetical protein
VQGACVSEQGLQAAAAKVGTFMVKVEDVEADQPPA